MDKLNAEGKQLTDKKLITANKRAVAQIKAVHDVAKARSEEIHQDYKNKVEERNARQEEEAFQKRVEEEYERLNTLRKALETAESNLEKYNERAKTLKFEAAKKKNDAQIAFWGGDVKKKQGELKVMEAKLNALQEDRARKQDEARSQKEAAEK